MVSQPDQHYSASLALRGASGGGGGHSHSSSAPHPHAAASVAGGDGSGGHHSSYSRSRRYNRSHAGGSSSLSPAYNQLNEFPVFTNSGNVEIIVRVRSGHENRYLLHRDTLARCSGFFEASTSKMWSRAQVVGDGDGDGSDGDGDTRALTNGDEVVRRGGASGASGGTVDTNGLVGGRTGGPVRRRWRYELDLGQGENDKPILVQKADDGRAAAPAAATAAATSQSIFGGGPVANNARTNGSSSSSSSSARASTHANPSFFRSVANLALSHTPRHQSGGSSYGGGGRSHGHGYGYGYDHGYGYGYGNPLYDSSTPLLPPATPDEIDLLRDYDNLFRIMYNYPPVLDGVNIADAYVQCKSLLAVADEYDALPFVGPRVDHHLLQFQSRLWRQIAKYPISYLRLGYLARSRVIFHEALVHVVGQWPAGERSLRAALPDPVLDLIEDKVDELADAVSRAEARLFRLHLTTRGGERVTPATSYLDWLAVSLFRQWLADNTTPVVGGEGGGRGGGIGEDDIGGRGSRKALVGGSRSRHGYGHGHQSYRGGRTSSSSSASSGSGRHPAAADAAIVIRTSLAEALAPPPPPPLAVLGRTYRILGLAPPAAFLAHDECKRFLKLSPDLYTRDNLRRFEKRIDELKGLAREIVRPLMDSGLELDVVGGGGKGSGGSSHDGSHNGITYFTCTYVSDRDLPWLVGP